jgi:hypothetical protein
MNNVSAQALKVTTKVLSDLREFRLQPKFEDARSAASVCGKNYGYFGIDSSDGLLNNWRYGFDPNAKP